MNHALLARHIPRGAWFITPLRERRCRWSTFIITLRRVGNGTIPSGRDSSRPAPPSHPSRGVMNHAPTRAPMPMVNISSHPDGMEIPGGKLH